MRVDESSFGQVAWGSLSNDPTTVSSEARLGDSVRFLLIAGATISAIGTISLFDRQFAGLLYCVFFAALAWVRFDLALALTFASVPFQQDLGGLPIKFSIAEFDLCLLAPISILRSARLPLASKLIVPPVCFLVFCVFVSANRFDSATIKSLIQMALYIVLSVGIFSDKYVRPQDFYRCFDSLVIVGSALCLLGIVTNFRFLGIHKNGWGASISLALVVAFEMWQSAQSSNRKYWYGSSVGLLTIGLVLTVSRGGWMAAIVGIGVLLSLRRDWRTLGRLLLAVIPLVSIGWLLLPEDLQEYAVGFESKRYNIQMRWKSIDLAVSLWQQSPWFGTGIGLRKQYDATNVVLLTLAESGIVGLVLFSFVHLNIGIFVWRNHFRLDTSSAAFSCLALGGALVAARLAHGMVDHYWSRGAILAAWAAAGMAIVASRDHANAD